MIRINLLPHREERRKQQKQAFVVLMALGAVLGVAVVLMVGGYNARAISVQNQRNQIITEANKDLDKKIVEIASLKQEIEALKARQQAVEDLQGDRNQPVYLMDELVKQTPEGVFLKSFKQDGQKVTLAGYAQSQERVSGLLRNLAGISPWLERPDLIEVRSSQLPQGPGGKGTKKVVEFSMNVGIKRPRDLDKAKLGPDGKPLPGASAEARDAATPATTIKP